MLCVLASVRTDTKRPFETFVVLKRSKLSWDGTRVDAADTIKVAGKRSGAHERVVQVMVIRVVYHPYPQVQCWERKEHEVGGRGPHFDKIVLLRSCKGFKTIRVKNLPRLYELQIALDAVDSTALEISNVPNLGVFSFDLYLRSRFHPHLPFNAYAISLGSNVTQLRLAGVVTDNACLDAIKSGFPFLESLTLDLASWMLESFHFTCASIKILPLLSCPDILIDVQVHAPKLKNFKFCGDTLPSLLFPVSSLNRLWLSLSLDLPFDANFFLKMREALVLSRECYLDITTHNSELPFDMDMDDLRTRLLLPPALNVQQLCFETDEDDCLWERSPFFEAFFEICHPRHVIPYPDISFSHNNHFCRLMLREVLEKKKKMMMTVTAYWPHYLKHVQIRQDPYQKWKTLTNSHRSFLDGSSPDVDLEFKLEWC
ncbi:hypothetical protein L1887_40016 [Cichorium endivia]|nr:hypothetical protein L1887_40016 [Cichorium endivia]